LKVFEAALAFALDYYFNLSLVLSSSSIIIIDFYSTCGGVENIGGLLVEFCGDFVGFCGDFVGFCD
jgi:hypothetical protein